jgi:hypothetical protein
LLATTRADDVQAPVVCGALVGAVNDGVFALANLLLMNMDDVLHSRSFLKKIFGACGVRIFKNALIFRFSQVLWLVLTLWASRQLRLVRGLLVLSDCATHSIASVLSQTMVHLL